MIIIILIDIANSETNKLFNSFMLSFDTAYLPNIVYAMFGWSYFGMMKKKKWKIWEKTDGKGVWLKGRREKIDGVLLFSLRTHQNWRENKNENKEWKLIGMDKIKLPFWTKNWTSQCHAHKLIRSSPSHIQKIEIFFCLFSLGYSPSHVEEVLILLYVFRFLFTPDLFIYLNFKKTVLIFELLVIFYCTFFLWSIHWYINF